MRKLNAERMRYKKDSLSFALCILGLFCNALFFIVIYRNSIMTGITAKEGFAYYMIGVDIIYNILLILMLFYAAEELKIYRRGWSVAVAVMGLIQLPRTRLLPLQFLEGAFYEKSVYDAASVLLCVSCAFLLAAAAVSFYKSTVLYKFLKENGYGRAYS